MSDEMRDNEPVSDTEDPAASGPLVGTASGRLWSPSEARNLSAQDHRQAALAALTAASLAVLALAASAEPGVATRARQAEARNMMQPPVTTCSEVGCNGGYNAHHDCQCTSSCSKYGNCCLDYHDECAGSSAGEGGHERGASSDRATTARDPRFRIAAPPQRLVRAASSPRPADSCQVFGCVGAEFEPGAKCQCTKECEQYHNCCRDYNATCGFSRPGCHTAGPGGACYDAVIKAMTEGIKDRPQDFPGLSERSTFAEFQVHLHDKADEKVSCPLPCKAVGTPSSDCLCLFDVDRTLTSKQNDASAREPGQCREYGTYMVPGVSDNAYGGGTMVLSELAQNIEDTFCGTCYRGVISHGDVGGPNSPERRFILAALGGPEWTLGDRFEHVLDGRHSTLMVGVPNDQKHFAADDIVTWLFQQRGVEVEKERVYFFDDILENVQQFAGTGMNAQQISCVSRDKSGIGLCGGRAEELSDDHGVLTCEDKGSFDESLEEEEGSRPKNPRADSRPGDPGGGSYFKNE